MKNEELLSKAKTFRIITVRQSEKVIDQHFINLSDDDLRLKRALKKAVEKDFAPEKLREKLGGMLRKTSK